MPLPKPRKDEKHDAWMDRCMGDDTMTEEYPDSDQRYAVCQSQWDDKDDKEDKAMVGKVMGKVFWKFTMQAATKSADLTLYGEIASQTWWGDEVTPKQFAADLKALGDIDNLNIHIFSAGGDPFAAHAIHAMLRAHKAYKTVYVEGLAASAASLVVMAGDKVIMYGNSMLMVHNPWTIAAGDSADFRQMADALDKVRDSMLVTYQAKTGLSSEEIVKILDAETWMTAEDAVEKGFADEVAAEQKMAASLRDGKFLINGREVDIAAYRNFPKERFPEAPAKSAEPAVPGNGPAPNPPGNQVDNATPSINDNPPPAVQVPPGDKSADVEPQAQLELLRMRARALQVEADSQIESDPKV